MATNDHIIERVLDLVSHLRGPACSADEVQWATDIPAGSQLLEWLASQVSDYQLEEAITTNDPTLNHDILETVLSPIALYTEEVDILDTLKLGEGLATEHDAPPRAVARYELPSQLRMRAEVAESEAAVLEKQAARLKHRLDASKAAEKGLKKAIHILRRQIQAVDDTIQEQQQRLVDISGQADDTMTRHINLALCLLQDAVLPSRGKDDALKESKSELASLSASRTSVASSIKQLYQTLDDVYAALPAPSDLQHDASVLHTKLKEATKGVNVDKLVEAAYVEELGKMAKNLEERDEPEEIALMLKSSSKFTEQEPITLDVDVKQELERAGRMDRLVLLKTQAKGLDTVITFMRDELVPPLQAAYNALYARSTLATEAEAIISALIEELEDIHDAVESTQRPTALGSRDEEDREELLEMEVINLMKNLLGSGHEGGGKPTILLNRSDAEDELAALSQRLTASQRAEEKWAADRPGCLTDLTSSIAPLLSTVYANSPVNTSPPFAPSPAQVALFDGTRARAGELTDAATRLQKETGLSSRDKRKLAAFVEKWMAK